MPIRDLSRPEPGLPKWRPKPRLKVFRSSSSWVPPRRIVILGEEILHLLFVIPVFGCLFILRDKSMSGCECKLDRAQPFKKRNHRVESEQVHDGNSAALTA